MLGSLQAQAGTTGKIAGRVLDAATGEPLPGANVIVVGTSFGAATDASGDYIILRVPPGIYSVKASILGYDDMQYDHVKVSVDLTTHLDFRLRETVLEVAETVTVVAERPLVQMDLTSTSSVVGAETIRQLPVERFEDVVNLQAGVIQGHFRGGRLGEVAYLIDGIPVNDVYSGRFALEVENQAIQELEVISGTFNAEYGQAMSGVVNIVTKEGGHHYTGEVSGYLGDYLSRHENIFWNIEKYNPIYNAQASMSGPIPGLGNTLSFFASGRYYNNNGYIYGRRVFRPSDHSDFTSDDSSKWVIQSLGRQFNFSEALAQQLMNSTEAVSMNPNERMTGQLKLTYRLSDSDKLDYQVLWQRRHYRDYNHNFRLNPDGDYQRRQRGMDNTFVWNHVVSPRTFFSVKLSNLYTRYRQFVLENPFDPNYVSTARLQDAGANAFRTGGMQTWQFNRSTTTNLARLDLTSQVTKTHQLKLGVEAKGHRLWLHELEVIPELPQRINPTSAFNHNRYVRRPKELAAYLQDKMELPSMIVNAGLRFDQFWPGGAIPEDFKSPATSPLKKAEATSQLSPRFGIAYPITDRGVIHVSYGHFFQIPTFEFLYTNPEFDIFPLQATPSPPPVSVLNTVGNAGLRPQKTVIYEIGLQQQLSEDIGLDLTAYYKDIRNLLGTEVLQTLTGIRYARYINRDYGQVKGITLAFEKRYSQGFSANIDYTFQIAKGNASDPNSVFLDQQAQPPIESNKQMVPLDWDRRHQINATVTVGDPNKMTVSLIGRLGSGLPYTPSFQELQTAVENSQRRPTVATVDLYAQKYFKLGGLRYGVFLRVYNLFDRLNELEVYTDTGRAGYSLVRFYAGDRRPRGLNTLDEYLLRPDFYSEPRQVVVGASVEF